jgi:hypothetical protein
VLARFAEVVRPTPRPLPAVQAQELSALLARRRQLVAVRTAERQRLDTAVPAVRRTNSCMHKLLLIAHAILRRRTPWCALAGA